MRSPSSSKLSLLRKTADKSTTFRSESENFPRRLLPDHDLVLGEGNLGAAERYVTYAMGRLHLADRQSALMGYATDEQRLAILSLATRNRVWRDVVAARRHPRRVAAAKDLQKKDKINNENNSLYKIGNFLKRVNTRSILDAITKCLTNENLFL